MTAAGDLEQHSKNPNRHLSESKAPLGARPEADSSSCECGSRIQRGARDGVGRGVRIDWGKWK